MNSEMKLSTNLSRTGEKMSVQFQNRPKIVINGLMELETCPDSWSPLHLLLSAFESCFFLTFSAVAEKMRVKIKGYSSNVEGTLGSSDGKHKEFTQINLTPKVEFENTGDAAKLPQLLKMAEEHCPVARTLKAKLNIVA